MLKFDNFWVDPEYGNKWEISKYSKEEAARLSKTMVNCKGCINSESCKNCKGCVNCINCTNCDRCVNCSNCTRCINCHDCGECEWMCDSTSCTNCEDCVRCKDCHKCSFCDKCYGHVERSNYSSNYDILPDVYRREKLNKEMDERIFAKV